MAIQLAGRLIHWMFMNWFILILAGLFEVVWAVGLKYTEGFSKPVPTLITVGSLIVSFVLLGIAMKGLPMSTAYAVWVSVGMIGTAILGMALFAEPVTLFRLTSIALIIIGVVGLKVSSAA